MLKKILPLLVFLVLPAILSGQARTIKVEAGEDFAQAYSPTGFYRLADFTKATLHRHGRKENTEILVNYNLLYGTMQFINLKGDTLNMSNATLFDSIIAGESVFYPEDGFFELVMNGESARLAKKTIIKTRGESVGAFGTTNNSSGSDRVENHVYFNTVYKITQNQRMIVNETVEWYWIDDNRKFIKASKASLLQLLPPAKHKTVEAYLKENKTKFNKEDDLKKLMTII